MAAGSIVIDLLVKTGSFETDTARAEKRLKAFQKQIESVGTAIGTAIGVGVVAAAAAFQGLVAHVADFKDLEEQVGATAADLASLAIVASVAGTSVADIAANANKLTKNLSGVDDESKAAGAALSALGIPIEEFKRLDPVGQIDALSKAFNGFADGSQKTAVALALFGKNGASMLNVFKELDAEGGRNKILTQQQIELADEYIDRQKRQTATIIAYAQAAATDVLPALNALTGAAKDAIKELVGIDDQGQKMAGTSYVKQFAEASAIAIAQLIDSLGDAGAEITKFVAQTQKEFASVKFGGQVLANFGSIGEAIVEGTGPVADALRERNATIAEANAILAATTERDVGKYERQVRDALARTSELYAGFAKTANSFGSSSGGKPQLDFSGAQKAAKTPAQSEAERYLETLQKQAEKTLELNTYEQALLDIEQKRIKGITPELERQILAQAQFNDLNKQAIEFRTAEIEVQTARAKAQLAELDTITKSNEKLREEIDLLGLDADALNAVEIQKTRVAKAEKEAALAKAEALPHDEASLQVLQAEIAALEKRESLLLEKGNKQSDIEARKNTDSLAKDAGTAMSESIAEGILDGTRKGLSFTDVFVNELKAQFAKTILAPIIKPVVDAQNQGVSQILSLLGGLAGLSGNNTTDYRGTTLPNTLRGGADTGTNMLERDMITLVHKGEAIVPKAYNPAAGGRGAGGGNVYITNTAGAQVSAQRDQNGDFRVLVETASDVAYGRTVRDLATGTGPASIASRQRGGIGPGSLARRG